MAEAEDPPAPAEAVEEVIKKVVVANGGIVAVFSLAFLMFSYLVSFSSCLFVSPYQFE